MSLLTELYHAYNASKESGLVDQHEINRTTLLPIYHNNMTSNGKNIVRVHLNKDSTLERAEFVPEDEDIIFPVNEASVARSGRKPPAHPLVDKLNYIVPSDSWKHNNFKDAFINWFNYIDQGHDKEYLKIIKDFISKNDMLQQILDYLFQGRDYKLNDFVVEYTENAGKKEKIRKLKLKDVFLTYSINAFDGLKNRGVTKNKSLHNSYIDFIDANLTPNGMCNVTGKHTYISSKHRGLMGNAKLVSVSNNTETYKGRFTKKADVFNMGYKASEKIHLMLKYLLENDNTNRWLGEQQYLINWLSTDINNESGLNILDSDPLNFFGDETEENTRNEESYEPDTVRNKQVGKSFYSGRILFNENSQYYAAIIDKSSNGRLSVKYFKKIPTSQLVKNLEKWQLDNRWETYNYKNKQTISRPPSVTEIVQTTYGIERNGKLLLDNGNLKKVYIRQL